MLTVKGHRLLVKPDPVKDQFQVPDALKKAGFEVSVGAEERRHLVATEIGTLVGIGNTAWRAYDGKDENWQPWAKIGDRVTFVKYAGKLVTDPVTKEDFFVLDDVDMQCIVTGEASPFGD
jgi:co-chaperonin GroES (HSP10)